MVDQRLVLRINVDGVNDSENTIRNFSSNVDKSFRSISKTSNTANKDLDQINNTIKNINNNIKQVSGIAVGFFSLRGISSVFRSIIDASSGFELLRTRLETATGSADNARDAFSRLGNFSNQFGIDIESATQAFVSLRNAGIQPTIETLTGLGNIAAASGKSITEIANSLVTAGASGLIERFRQLGISAKTVGDNFIISFRGISQEVRRSELPAFLTNLGNTQFAGALEKQSQTLQASLTRLQNSFSVLGDSIGKSGIIDGVTSIVNSLSKFTKSSSDTSSFIGNFADRILKQISGIIDGIGGLDNVLKGLFVGGVFVLARKSLSDFSASLFNFTKELVKTKTASNAFAIVSEQLKNSLVVLKNSFISGGFLAILGRVTAAIAGATIIYNLFKSAIDAFTESGKKQIVTMENIQEVISRLAASSTSLSEPLKKITIEIDKFGNVSEETFNILKDLDSLTDKLKTSSLGNLFGISAKQILDNKELITISKSFKEGSISVEQYLESLQKIIAASGNTSALLGVEEFADKFKSLNNSLVDSLNSRNQTTTNILSRELTNNISSTISNLRKELSELEKLNEARKQGEEGLNKFRIEQEKSTLISKLQASEQEKLTTEYKNAQKEISQLLIQLEKQRSLESSLINSDKQRLKDLKLLNNSYKDSGIAIDKLIAKRDALNNARDRVLSRPTTTSEDLTALENSSKAIEKLNDDIFIKTLENSNKLTDGIILGGRSVLDSIKSNAKQIETLFKSSIDNLESLFVDFFSKGQLNFKNFVSSILSDISRLLIRRNLTAPIANAFAGILPGVGANNSSSNTAARVAHSGGVVGLDNFQTRNIPTYNFDSAARFHQGGVVGRNEVPIIANRGEAIFTPEQMRLLKRNDDNAPQNVNIEVNVENNARNTTATATTNRDSSGNVAINVIVEQIEGEMSNNLVNGRGIAPAIEKLYGLNRSEGNLI